VPYLIDGDNLLGTWPGRKRSDPERRRLAMELARFGSAQRRKVVVVFDGAPAPGQAYGSGVHFSGPGRTADDLILELLRGQRDRRGWIVITSDRSLGDQCRYLEARVERSDRFRARLGRESDGEKPERESEIEYWLEQFGGTDESDHS
jgi:predicted RNA-binding protein with PIN domain